MASLVPIYRRAWYALPVYAAIFILAILYLTNVTKARALTAESDGVFVNVWNVVLLVSAGAAIGCLCSAKRFLPRALIIESVCAAVIAVQCVVYVASITVTATLSAPPWATVCSFGAITGMCLVRAALAVAERSDLADMEKLAHAIRASGDS